MASCTITFRDLRPAVPAFLLSSLPPFTCSLKENATNGEALKIFKDMKMRADVSAFMYKPATLIIIGAGSIVAGLALSATAASIAAVSLPILFFITIPGMGLGASASVFGALLTCTVIVDLLNPKSIFRGLHAACKDESEKARIEINRLNALDPNGLYQEKPTDGF